MIVNVEHGHFVVDYSAPVENADGRRWNRNGSVDVVCASAERAIEIFRGHEPDLGNAGPATIHVVRRVGGRTRLLVDVPDAPDVPWA